MESHTASVSYQRSLNYLIFLVIEEDSETGITIVCEYKNGCEYGKQTYYRE